MDRKAFLLLILISFSSGCGSSEANSSNSALTGSGSPSPTLKSESTPTDEELKAKSKLESDQQHKAIEDYINKNQKGWTLSGMSGAVDEPSCLADSPCYLHLTQKGKSKVVPVMVRKFESEDGNSYWLVYEAKTFDLISYKIEELKQTAMDGARDDERRNTLASLTMEDCQPLLDEAAEDAHDARDDGYDGPY